MNDTIPTYVINLKKRPARKEHILKEFAGRNEFDVTIVEAHEHEIGAVGLWNTIRHIIQNLAQKNEEYILICEDDHQFTEHYTKEHLLNCIAEAKINKADVLLGGIHWVQSTFAVSKSLHWAEGFTATQFTIIFRTLYKAILAADFGEYDAADFKISSLTNNKFFIYPFVSIQKEFGYSDATLRNNMEGRVTELFNNTAIAIQFLLNVANVYKIRQENITVEDDFETTEHITIPTYVINLPERPDRKEHVQKQFEGRNEFEVTIVAACQHEIDAVGLWQTVRNIVQKAIDNKDDVIIICEDGHEFTSAYSKEVLLKNIIEAHQHGADILLGGISHFDKALYISDNMFWINLFRGNQFVVIYNKLFQEILNEPFDTTVNAAGLLSEITSNKIVMFPFFSTQKFFDMPDVSLINKSEDVFGEVFNDPFKRLENIRNTYLNNQYLQANDR